MLSRLKVSLLVPALLIGLSGLRAQETDYLKHRKSFDLCGFKKECEHCYSCEKQRYIVKINNKEDKKITRITYSFYSDVFNKVLTKEADIKGKKIDPKSIGLFYICVPVGNHWAVRDIEYGDESKASFVVKERMNSFLQEADECDCND